MHAHICGSVREHWQENDQNQNVNISNIIINLISLFHFFRATSLTNLRLMLSLVCWLSTVMTEVSVTAEATTVEATMVEATLVTMEILLLSLRRASWLLSPSHWWELWFRLKNSQFLWSTAVLFSVVLHIKVLSHYANPLGRAVPADWKPSVKVTLGRVKQPAEWNSLPTDRQGSLPEWLKAESVADSQSERIFS